MEEQVVSNATENQVSNQENLKNDVVKYETHQKLLGQHKKAQEKLNSYEAELAKYRQAEAEMEQNKLAEEGKYKEILKLKEEKLTEYQEKLNVANEREATTFKLQSFYNKLPGQIKHNDYLAHVKLDKIIYDSESMQCDQDSVEAVVNEFMEKHSDLVMLNNKAKLPSESPNTTTNLNSKLNNNQTPEQAMKEKLARLYGV